MMEKRNIFHKLMIITWTVYCDNHETDEQLTNYDSERNLEKIIIVIKHEWYFNLKNDVKYKNHYN